VNNPAGRVVKRLAASFLLLAGLLLDGGTVWPDEYGYTLPQKVLEGARAKYGPDASERLLAWQRLLLESRDKSEREKLTLVNDFFNKIPFLSDAEHWGREDFWATPVEMLASHGGDCEDFSIAKYVTLTQLGVPMDKLKITYVRARIQGQANQAHMVLTYYPTPDAMPLVLDNLVPEIRSADLRPDLLPVYSFNGAGLWLARERGQGKPVAGGAQNIGFWRELKARMGKEFE